MKVGKEENNNKGIPKEAVGLASLNIFVLDLRYGYHITGVELGHCFHFHESFPL